jgi:hypothetical protein
MSAHTNRLCLLNAGPQTINHAWLSHKNTAQSPTTYHEKQNCSLAPDYEKQNCSLTCIADPHIHSTQQLPCLSSQRSNLLRLRHIAHDASQVRLVLMA